MPDVDLGLLGENVTPTNPGYIAEWICSPLAIKAYYREFAHGFYRFISRPFYRPVGPAPDEGTQATTARINETIDRSVFDRWRADKSYRPPNLAAWAKGKDVDPGNVVGAVRATDPKVGVA